MPAAAVGKNWIVTESGNRISKRGLVLRDTQSIVLGGKVILESHTTIRGDLKPPSPPAGGGAGETAASRSAVVVGRYVHVMEGCTLLPPHDSRGHHTLRVGDYVSVGPNTLVSSAQIASCVKIGANCTLGNLSIVKEGVVIDDGTSVPERAVIPAFSRVSGVPGLVVEELPECITEVIRDRMRENYTHYTME